ncbi:MAG: DUF4271 domain-containing protein [Muribaculaceae bacterium]|nr:DUF4271 domain-containing protein [Muribaculaceae bacterium]
MKNLLQQTGPEFCRLDDAPLSAAQRDAYTAVAVDYHRGETPAVRPLSPAGDSPLIALLLMLVVLLMFNANHGRRLFRNLGQQLWGTRQRQNAFDEHTANETQTFVLLIFMLCVGQALLLYTWFAGNATVTSYSTINQCLLALLALTAGFFVFKELAIVVIGNTFTDSHSAALWTRGFNTCLAFLGVLTIVPALVAVFYPAAAFFMIIVAFCLFLGAEISFVIKGFKIFYDNFSDLLYFILYLCSLEIIPIIIVYFMARAICSFYIS